MDRVDPAGDSGAREMVATASSCRPQVFDLSAKVCGTKFGLSFTLGRARASGRPGARGLFDACLAARGGLARGWWSATGSQATGLFAGVVKDGR